MNLLLFFGPTLMLFLGLQVMSSVPVAFVLFYGWLALVPACDFLWKKRLSWADSLRSLGLSNRTNLLAGIALGICSFSLILSAGYFFHGSLFDRGQLQQLLVRWNFSGDLFIWLVMVLILVNPVLEEMYWRGYLLQKLVQKRSTQSAVLVTSLGYSLYHLLSIIPLFAAPYNILLVIPVFVAGIVWGYMRCRSGTLFGAIACHVLADAGIIGVYVMFLA